MNKRVDSLARRWFWRESMFCCFDFAFAVLGRATTSNESTEIVQSVNEHLMKSRRA